MDSNPQSVWVVGGGPSLEGFDFSRLAGKRVIAVNAAYPDVPWAEYVVFSDGRFWEWNRKSPAWKSFRGRKVTTWKRPPYDCERWVASGQMSLSFLPRVLGGASSGCRAFNLAAQICGGAPIYLLGYDMQANGNYHGRHLLGNRQGHYDKFLTSMTKLVTEAQDRYGLTVYNCCVDSALTAAPRISLDEAFAHADNHAGLPAAKHPIT